MAGRLTTEPKEQFVPEVEEVALAACGTVIKCTGHAFYVMHKPKDVVCQRDPNVPNVYDLIPTHLQRVDLGCVGRLDRDTTGTLLFATDGGVSSMLLHPSSRVWKTYSADIESSTTIHSDAVERFHEGITLADGTHCSPAELEVISEKCVRVTLHEGFFHQVKRMLAHVGATVVGLHRDRFGRIDVANVKPGEMRSLSSEEMHALKHMLPIDRTSKRDTPAERWKRARA